jgi:FKBP-type peptidyl-prolyl cis-trans isomerase 2
MEVASGRVATIEYTVRLGDGTPVDSTGECGPLSVMCGSGELFPALEARIVGMRAGETRELEIPPDEAYGERREELVREMPRDRLPPDLELVVGQEYRWKSPDGKVLRFRLLELGDTMVCADFNPARAGQALRATVTVVSVRPATPDEERRGRV